MSSMQDLNASSHLSGGNMAYVDSLFDDYQHDPQSVPADWRKIFEGLSKGETPSESTREVVEYFRQLAMQKGQMCFQAPAQQGSLKQAEVTDLIHNFRAYGHLMAKTNPLDDKPYHQVKGLRPEQHGLSIEKDQENFFVSDSLAKQPLKLSELYPLLQKTYCGSIGLEYMHITNEQEKNWWQNHFETAQGRLNFTSEEQKHLLKELIAADGFERYLHTRFVGQKRFSLEGGDALIPMLKDIFTRCAKHQVEEVIVGMAHRGRLNVLVNVFGKAPSVLFEEFAGKMNSERTGDVKYHLGFSADLAYANNDSIHAVLAFNPSHLEIISPVVEGAVRARLCRNHDLIEKSSVLPVAIHGDSAFTGQGVVMETFNFSQARGYSTGGTIHIVINNQVGFTTNRADDARSSDYCTDIAKMVQAPVLHVNGDDPEAVIFAAKLAFDYRRQFKRDVVIDLVCYRRQGHNEADEAMLTQPLMYQNIKQRPVLRELYARTLIAKGMITDDWYQAEVDAYRQSMDEGKPLVALSQSKHPERALRWNQYLGVDWTCPAKTGVSQALLLELSTKLNHVPEGFNLHSVVQKTITDRRAMIEADMPMNWGCAETLAFASILKDGYEIRISGQDSGRGTFSHRHAVWHDQKTAQTYMPLQQFQVSEERPFNVIDSVLSEEAVLAFEYGYAASEPDALVIWEAQFGDFANGAQVVIDQFISSGEQKWGRLCGLVMLLPHGYEGQGPEHSSARLERFMQLCAQQNIQVCVPSTPAQIFHLLRRQMIRPYRKPLIVMTPKSLLRHKMAVSSVNDLVNGKWLNVIDEQQLSNKSNIEKMILCCGKVYYDLLQAREEYQIHHTAIVRIEQLYPFPEDELKAILAQYPNLKELVWCQEEPQNQGAWFTSQHHMLACLKPSQTLTYAGRAFAAAPAVGSPYLHAKEQAEFIAAAFALQNQK
ncbi:MAG: 2-oxoglutarate dehydrogenase E1 component [Gammaproteobacteria bacterium]|nr:2-oxoglutarate dehydrogenase E1 component [Gammaproteobacteria bacterium]